MGREIKQHLCNHCGQTDPTRFPKKQKSICYSCKGKRDRKIDSHNEYQRTYYNKNSTKVNERRAKLRREKGVFPKEIKPHLCELCGETDLKNFKNKMKGRCKSCQQKESNLKYKEKRQIYEQSPFRRFSKNLRNRQSQVMKGMMSTTKGLGCNSTFLRSYIENLWEPWMNWDNYGIGEGEWSVDHIVPLSSFEKDGEGNWDPNSEYNKKLIHYTNLRPLLHKVNLEKSSKLLDIY